MSSDEQAPLGLFQGYGIELEYMIVRADTLDVLPVSDQILAHAAGEIVSEVELGATAWSNELVLHVLELKTNGPAPALEPLPALFQADVARINAFLAGIGGSGGSDGIGGRLLPTAMHPWFDPEEETRLWPHDYSAVYEQFDRIFGCRGHGWSNLQSMHLNLPFADDAEFGRLHAAIRLVLPILPALAASSPFVENKPTGILDNRLAFYRINSARIPAVTGRIVPEPVYTEADYTREILERIWAETAPNDPQGILRHEWANARGAIARFDRQAIEIRVLDIQEHPRADLAIAAAIVATLKALIAERWQELERQQRFPVEPLHAILLSTMLEGESAVISDREYLDALGFPPATRTTAGELWAHLIGSAGDLLPAVWRPALEPILREGTLARRILRAVGSEARIERIREVYAALAGCLSRGEPFSAA
ncbi:MAG: glutamate--cysteine ligase [Deltaproteobacteria bacterium]|nr:glutamate--cysteine ligase [Deltaproteobacteria bacterium]